MEGLLAGGMLDEAEPWSAERKRAQVDLGQAGSSFPEGGFCSRRTAAAEARPFFERALASFEGSGLPLWAWRAAALAAEAAAQSGDDDAARSLLASCIRDAHRAGAIRARDAALAVAERFGLEVPPLEDEPDSEVSRRVSSQPASGW